MKLFYSVSTSASIIFVTLSDRKYVVDLVAEDMWGSRCHFTVSSIEVSDRCYYALPKNRGKFLCYTLAWDRSHGFEDGFCQNDLVCSLKGETKTELLKALGTLVLMYL